MSFCTNVGPFDRAVRALIGLAAMTLAITSFHVLEASPLGIIAAAIGVIMLLTAVAGFCPLYLPFKLTTCRASPR